MNDNPLASPLAHFFIAAILTFVSFSLTLTLSLWERE